MDALGLPIRFTITPGQWGDCPQARGLIGGLTGVGHVMADAAYDADYLRQFIVDDLGATAQIKQNPTRTAKHTIDWIFYKERHLVERFFNRIKRFRNFATVFGLIPNSRLNSASEACPSRDHAAHDPAGQRIAVLQL